MNDLLNQQDFEVRFGSIQNPYQEFTFTIAASGEQKVYFAHNYFRVLSISGGSLFVRFGGSGAISPWTGAGLALKIPFVVSQVELRNNGGAPMTITIALAIGEIMDDRLQTYGTVTVNQTKATGGAQPTDVTLAAGVATLISATDSTRRSAIITNLDTANPIRIGYTNALTATRGEYLAPLAKTSVETTLDIYGFSAAGTTVSVRTEVD